MDKVVGLGRFGCLIAEQLTSYPEYRVYKIDSDPDRDWETPDLVFITNLPKLVEDINFLILESNHSSSLFMSKTIASCIRNDMFEPVPSLLSK